jgi:CRISPR system Cascade subunit CasC
MSLFIEFHLIQNFAPSNLNRDDTGAPKDAIFGGQRRARVSSQCLKRSARDWFCSSTLIPDKHLGTRTRHLDRTLLSELQAIGIANTDSFNEIVKLALKDKKAKDEKEKEKTEKDEQKEKVLSYLLYLSVPEIDAFRALVGEHQEILKNLAAKKKIKASDIPNELKNAVKECLSRSNAVDVALFGRMLADLPEQNQHAACQVAHAISTHRVEREFDYFTAVDDKGDVDETGAGMIGQVEFNSATFYRYAVIDPRKLVANLKGDKELALKGIGAFAQAMARAIPTGKQNTFAAHNPPSFVGVVLRHSSPFNLANAFEKPIWPRQDKELTAQSVERLAVQETSVAEAYGDGRDVWVFLDLTGEWPTDKGQSVKTLDALADWVVDHIRAELGA